MTKSFSIWRVVACARIWETFCPDARIYVMSRELIFKFSIVLALQILCIYPQRYWWCHHTATPTSQTPAVWFCVLATCGSVVADLWSSAGGESGNSAVWGDKRQSKHLHTLPHRSILLHSHVHWVKCAACGPFPAVDTHQTGLEMEWCKWDSACNSVQVVLQCNCNPSYPWNRSM